MIDHNDNQNQININNYNNNKNTGNNNNNNNSLYKHFEATSNFFFSQLFNTSGYIIKNRQRVIQCG